jgi:hypothetical protein
MPAAARIKEKSWACEEYLRRITIVAFSSPPLARVIGHVFRGCAEFEVVGVVNDLDGLSRQAGQLLVDVVVADVKPVRSGVCKMVASIRQHSPLSKVILISPLEDLAWAMPEHGADACLRDEKLVGRLLRTARTLARRPGMANASN